MRPRRLAEPFSVVLKEENVSDCGGFSMGVWRVGGGSEGGGRGY